MLADEGVVLGEEVECPDVHRRVAVGGTGVGGRMREGGEESGGSGLDRISFLRGAVQGFEIGEERRDTFLKAGAEIGLDEAFEVVTCND